MISFAMDILLVSIYVWLYSPSGRMLEYLCWLHNHLLTHILIKACYGLAIIVSIFLDNLFMSGYSDALKIY